MTWSRRRKVDNVEGSSVQVPPPDSQLAGGGLILTIGHLSYEQGPWSTLLPGGRRGMFQSVCWTAPLWPCANI